MTELVNAKTRKDDLLPHGRGAGRTGEREAIVINDIPDDLPDTSAWHDCPCPTCGGPARTRSTNPILSIEDPCVRAAVALDNDCPAKQEWESALNGVASVRMRDGDRYYHDKTGWWARPDKVTMTAAVLHVFPRPYPTLADAMAAVKAWRERGRK